MQFQYRPTQSDIDALEGVIGELGRERTQQIASLLRTLQRLDQLNTSAPQARGQADLFGRIYCGECDSEWHLDVGAFVRSLSAEEQANMLVCAYRDEGLAPDGLDSFFSTSCFLGGANLKPWSVRATAEAFQCAEHHETSVYLSINYARFYRWCEINATEAVAIAQTQEIEPPSDDVQE